MSRADYLWWRTNASILSPSLPTILLSFSFCYSDWIILIMFDFLLYFPWWNQTWETYFPWYFFFLSTFDLLTYCEICSCLLFIACLFSLWGQAEIYAVLPSEISLELQQSLTHGKHTINSCWMFNEKFLEQTVPKIWDSYAVQHSLIKLLDGVVVRPGNSPPQRVSP